MIKFTVAAMEILDHNKNVVETMEYKLFDVP